jgi:hypothetical protein
MIEFDNDSSVSFWTKKHGFVIQYKHLNINKRYLPDFFINDNTVIEVKGYVKDIPKFKLKTEAALKYFNNINIDYKLDFMKNEKIYNELLNWFNITKNKYYAKNKN